MVGHLLVVVRDLAARRGLTRGYRVVLNCGPDSGQAVPHLHFHLLGGRGLVLAARMSWLTLPLVSTFFTSRFSFFIFLL